MRKLLVLAACFAVMLAAELHPTPRGVSLAGRLVDPFDLGTGGKMRPVAGASISVLQDPTILVKSRRDGSFELRGVPAGGIINLLVNKSGFDPTISQDISAEQSINGITVYAVRTWVTSAGGVALTTGTGIIGNPRVGMKVDRRFGLIGGLVVDADSGERLPGASVQLLGRGEVGAQMQHLFETEKLTFTSPSLGWPPLTGGFMIPNVPAGEELDLVPTRTGSAYTKANYEFDRTGVVSVPGAFTFVVLRATKATNAVSHARGSGNSPRTVSFVDVTAAIGASFEQRTRLPFFNRYLHALGPGIAVNDYDADGHLDFYVSNGLGFPNALFRNRGNGTFERLDSPEFGGDLREDGGVAFGDINNDGYPDLYVASSQRNTLYLNNRDGTFTDITEAAGVGGYGRNARSVSFVDYDNDGLLDIFVSNWDLNRNANFDRDDNPGQGSVLYRNNGDLTFTDVTAAAGIGRTGLAFAQTFTDYDNDGDQDLFLVHDVGRIILFQNDGHGHFKDVSAAAGFTQTGSWMCAASGDYNNDGHFDFFATNSGPPMQLFAPMFPGRISNNMHALYRNNGDGTFTDVAREAGVADAGFGWGCEFGDVDNDGFLDLVLVTNYFFMGVGNLGGPSLFGRLPEGGLGGTRSFLFLNNGDGTFRNVTREAGIDNPFDARGVTLADFDGDGFLDIFITNERGPLRVYRNQGNDNHWLKVKLVGTRSNRDAIGARVRLVAGGREQVREVSGGSSYKSQKPFEVHFGLGQQRRVDLVEARFPHGGRVILRDLEADRTVKIIEP
jgi:enediyne biosynthesis protein E4